MAAETKEWKFLGLNMWQQVLVGLILGIASGFLFKENAGNFAILGTIFIKLIKMVVSPLIFFALIAGITSLSAGHSFKGIALRGTFTYIATSLCAVCLGLALGHFFTPGLGVAPPPAGAFPLPTAAAAPPPHMKDFLMGLIPGNIVHAISEDIYLQVVLFAIFTGIVMNYIPDETARVKRAQQTTGQHYL